MARTREQLAEISAGTQFSSTNQPANPGRKPLLVSGVIAELKSEGYEVVTSGQVVEVVSVLLNLEMAKVEEIAANNDMPIYVQRIARRLAKASEEEIGGFIDKQLDRAHGKAIDRKEVTGKDGESLMPDPLANLPVDKKAEILRIINAANVDK